VKRWSRREGVITPPGFKKRWGDSGEGEQGEDAAKMYIATRGLGGKLLRAHVVRLGLAAARRTASRIGGDE
jgi:hypothetical protein